MSPAEIDELIEQAARIESGTFEMDSPLFPGNRMYFYWSTGCTATLANDGWLDPGDWEYSRDYLTGIPNDTLTVIWTHEDTDTSNTKLLVKEW